MNYVEIRRAVAERGTTYVGHLPDEVIELVVERVGGDADLAADALAMSPRPGWLFALTMPKAP